MGVAAIAGDPRFYQRTGPHSLATIAQAADATAPEGDARLLSAVAPLQVAQARHVSFLDNRRYLSAMRETQAGAVIVDPKLAHEVPPGTAAIVCANPYVGWAKVCALFHPPPPLFPGIHPSAVIADGARIDPSAEIGPLAVIGAGAEIGAGCRIGAMTVIGPGVMLGENCLIAAQVTISHALLGRRVVIHPGAHIGQDGFGFAVTPTGMVSVPQLGRVIIGDDVDIGAGTTIDRGSAQDTVIGAGTRIDNQVQIAHNVRLGRMCVIVAQVGISGSTTLDDFVMVGGQAGFVGHIHVGKGAKIGGQAGIMSDVPAGVTMIGSPATPGAEHFRQVALLRKLARRRKAGQEGTGRKDMD